MNARILTSQRPDPKGVAVAWQWGDDELLKVRTLAKNALIVRSEVDEKLTEAASRLLCMNSYDLYASSGISFPSEMNVGDLGTSIQELERAGLKACTNALSEFSAKVEGFNLATCREQCFHHDDVLADQHAYMAVVLAQTRPMSFHSMGNQIELNVGDVIVFDAQQPHALFRQGLSEFPEVCGADLSHRFVFGLASVPLNMKLRKQMGISIKKVPSYWKEMRHMNYSELSGEFI